MVRVGTESARAASIPAASNALWRGYEFSGWGQFVRALKLGSDAAPVALWVGPLEGFHLYRAYART